MNKCQSWCYLGVRAAQCLWWDGGGSQPGNGPDPIQEVILELFPHSILLFVGAKDTNRDNF